jgi:Calx-beta domain
MRQSNSAAHSNGEPVKKNRVNKICVPASICALFLILTGQAHAATFTVTNTNDSGAGSLRQAITDGVAATVGNAAHDTVIAFNISGTGLHTIRPASPLPPIKDLLIDGYTQPGSRANTLATGSDAILTIEIDGTNAGASANGLVNQGTVPGAGIPTVTVRGLVINRFGGAGIRVTGPGGAGFPGYLTLQGCYIGTDATGTLARGNGVGVEFGNDGQGVIGETTPDFAGNTTPWPAYRNVISGNVGAGIAFDSTDPLNPAIGTVRNAYIGTDAAGLAAVGNGGDGIAIGAEAAFGSQSFGTTIYLYDNVIAANAGDGIDTQGVGTQAVGNTIGSGIDGRTLGNQGNGAYFHGASIGALNAAFGQLGVPGPSVAHNAGSGVRIADTAVVDVSGAIYSNVGLGIDLAPAGATANDVGDADTGPNELLNYPVISSAAPGAGGTRIQGTINSRPNALIEVLLFMNAACNPSGSGEGQRSLGTVAALTTDSSGNATFDKQLGFSIDTVAFPVVTAQSRRFAEGVFQLPSPLEVSEYSPCFTVTGSAPLPTLGINDVSVNEGNAGTTTMTFTVTLSAAAASAVTVNYATADGTAAAGTDYAASSGTLTFSAGQLTKTLGVTINGDSDVEPNEAFVVNLSVAAGATIADAQGTGTITNDDVAPPPPLPTLSIDDVSVSEGNAGTKTATFAVTLSAVASGAVTVNYATADGTAVAGTDYVAANGTLTFAAGETTKSVVVTVNGDATVEPNETFAVNLSVASGATIADTSGQGTITNDDVAPPPGGGGGGGGGAMDPWLLAALGWLLMWKWCREGTTLTARAGSPHCARSSSHRVGSPD